MESLPSMKNCLKVKSAKEWVAEIADKQSAQVQWQTVQTNPGCNPAKFVSKCVIICEVEATGESKEEAEQEAALLLLTDKLKMSPSSLMALHSQSNGMDDGDVSETDDYELEEIINPVTELKVSVEKKKLLEANFVDVHEGGLQHRKIYTVTCVARTLDAHKIVCTGRRYTKRHAKKIAAIRVLREVNNIQGRSGGDPQEIDGASGGTKEISKKSKKASKKGAFCLNDVKEGIEAASRQSNPNAEGKAMRRRERCKTDDAVCPELMKDFLHVFAHVDKSDMLEKLLEADRVSDLPEGPEHILEQLARETGIKLSFSKSSAKPPKAGLPYLMVLELAFPVDVGCSVQITNKKVVHGVGFTEINAKANAAKAALDYIRGESNCIDLVVA